MKSSMLGGKNESIKASPRGIMKTLKSFEKSKMEDLQINGDVRPKSNLTF